MSLSIVDETRNAMHCVRINELWEGKIVIAGKVFAYVEEINSAIEIYSVKIAYAGIVLECIQKITFFLNGTAIEFIAWKCEY